MPLMRFVLKHRIFFNLLFYLLLLAGWMVYLRLPVDVYPDVPFNEASIRAVWPGATAKEVELLVTQKLEDEILSVQDIVKVRSVSARDRSTLNVKFEENLSTQQFQNRVQDLRAAVNRVHDLPSEMEETVVQALSAWDVFPLCQVVISAGDAGEPFTDDLEFQVRQVTRRLEAELRDVPGVQKVLASFRDPEIHIKVRLEDLWQLGYTLDELADRLRRLNQDFSAGQLNLSSTQFILMTKGGLEDPKKLEDLALFERRDLGPVRLGDVATVSAGFEEEITRERFNQRPCLTLAIVKELNADSVSIVQSVKRAVEEFKEAQSLPENVNIDVINDASQIIRSRINILKRNLAGGLVLVGALLWITVGARNAFLALLGIPFSVLSAFILFPVLGLTLNAISLFSLVLVSGMVVDDAIVVLESIYQKVESGLEIEEAVIRGSSEVLMPVVSASLTTIAAFLPMLMTEGIMGKYFSIIPKTVVVVLIASLVECFFILPVHYLDLHHLHERLGKRFRDRFGGTKKAESTSEKEPARGDQIFKRTADAFASLTERLIEYPWRMIVAGVLLVVASGMLTKYIPVELFPSDFQIYAVTVRLPEGSTLERSLEAAVYIEKHLQPQVDDDEVQYFFANVGQSYSPDNLLDMSPDQAQVLVFMHEDEKHPDRRLEKTRRNLEEAFAKPGAPPLRSMIVDSPNDGPPTGKPVMLRMQIADYELGERLADRVAEFLRTQPGVHSIQTDLDRGPLSVDLLLRSEARDLEGFDESQVGLVFQSANFGIKVGTFKDPRYGEAYDMRLLLDKKDRRDLQGLTAAPVRHPRSGHLLPVSQVATQEAHSSFKGRPHYGGRRNVTVTAEVDSAVTTSSEVNARLDEWLQESGIAAACENTQLGGEFEETRKSFDSMSRAFILAVILIYIILASQFGSYAQPIVILAAVPFAFVGVVLGLLAMNIPFTMTSFTAVIGLAGIVVNDTIVYVATVNRFRREEGLSQSRSIIEGVRVRLRPIVMTSVTTILGLLPMAIGIGGFSKIWSPFAATMSFGLTSALLLTLLVVPCLLQVIGVPGGKETSEESDALA
ncbi:Nickel and cobalt resistance protein CnrA [Planctomycetes bacterium Pan216]|uniref:Nickel and cobalt resistance protein CnrA n=1 Tax=Kolteria novifilia TaxID=2527975 RepID=A0A518AWV5_9BACT|nr:Nickel and cobalt resistance protein CnrA [Planctomycetes bacterium Pan216]